jgi:hypothetical protein
MKEVMKEMGLSNVVDLDSGIALQKGGVNKCSGTYFVFNEMDLMGKGYDIFETLKVKYLSAKNSGDKVATEKAHKKLNGWMKETSTVKSVDNIKLKDGDIPLELVSSENSSLSSAELTQLCGVNIG